MESLVTKTQQVLLNLLQYSEIIFIYSPSLKLKYLLSDSKKSI